MTLVWSPETASKAYIDTVQTCGITSKTSAAEFLSAMAAGYNAKLIVEAWTLHENGDVSNIITSTGLAIAAKYTHGRHVCIVPDEASRVEYFSAMQKISSEVSLPEVVVVEKEETMKEKLNKVDFLVLDGGRKDFARVLNTVKLNQHGSVLVCKRNITTLRWRDVIQDAKVSVVRAITLPFENNGLEIAYIASSSSYDGNLKSRKNFKRWIRHVDQKSGEEHVFWR
ncbi:unnamed protein product [Withania somnifera]